MSDQDIIDTIADDFNTEIVGNSIDYNGGRLTLSRSRDLAAQALAALHAAGYAVVKLPEVDEGQVDTWHDCAVHLDTNGDYVLQEDDMDLGTGIIWHTPAHARLVAAALLAATDAADAGK